MGRFIEDIFTKGDRSTDRLTYEGVCRTFPATLGLLITLGQDNLISFISQPGVPTASLIAAIKLSDQHRFWQGMENGEQYFRIFWLPEIAFRNLAFDL